MPTLLSALFALGQAVPATAAPAPVPVVYKAVTTIDLGGTDVNATVSRPEIQALHERERAKFPPLFTVRTSFDDELRESTDEVK